MQLVTICYSKTTRCENSSSISPPKYVSSREKGMFTFFQTKSETDDYANIRKNQVRRPHDLKVKGPKVNQADDNP